MTVDSSVETPRLRATVRDLLALSAIPETWVGREPPAIAADLADLLVGPLELDFAFVRLSDPTRGQVAEVTRGSSWKAFPQWLQEQCAIFAQISRKEIVTDVGGVEESCCGIAIPIGVNGERGLVAVASSRPNFPDEIDQLLLSVAANNAATAFQNAFLIRALRSAQDTLRANEQALRTARDELEMKVAERTSELQRGAQELQRTEFYLAEGQRLAHAGSWAFIAAGFEYWSSELFQIYGLDSTGAPPTKEEYLALVHPADRECVEQEIQKMLNTHQACDFTKRIVRPDGQIRSVRFVGVPAAQEGTFRRFVGTGMDVTEQEQLTKALRESKDELRQILDLTPQLIAVFGPHRERLYLNRISLDYLGITLDEWRCGILPGSQVHSDDAERLGSQWAQAISSGLAFEIEVRFRRSDGIYRWFLIRCNPVRDGHGEVLRWYAACTDIEDRKVAEDRLQRENSALREELNQASMFEEIVGSSEPLRKVLSQVSKVASSDSTILILGQTGTGKELIARAIHKRSRRAARPFIGVNCAAIPASLIASELFGHEKGAFTGATHRRLGRFEAANGGTLFLDEIGDLPQDIQIALLRVLQEREIERVGSERPVPVDVRVLTATHRDLDKLVSEGKFRHDLLYRLNVVPITMPSLRERAADIPILVEYFIARYGRKLGKKFQSIEKRTLKIMQEYRWPGNIRELQNVIERAVTLSDSEVFTVDDAWLGREPSEDSNSSESLNSVLLAHERQVIEAALAQSHGRISGLAGAAARLGIPDSTLEAKIKRLSIDKYRFKSPID